MEKQIIKTDKAPAAIGTYSQAIKVKANTLTFVSGQIPIDPASGELIGGDFGANPQLRGGWGTKFAINNSRLPLDKPGELFGGEG